MTKEKKVAVVAIGGNSLIKSKEHQTVQDQYKAAQETAYHLVDMILTLMFLGVSCYSFYLFFLAESFKTSAFT